MYFLCLLRESGAFGAKAERKRAVEFFPRRDLSDIAGAELEFRSLCCQWGTGVVMV